MKNIIKNFAVFFLIFAIIATIFSLFDASQKNVEQISVDRLIEEIKNDEVAKIEVRGSQLDVTLKNNSQQVSKKEINESKDKKKKENYLYLNSITTVRMKKQGQLRANDILALIIIIFGAVGFTLWGIGISSIGNTTLQWLGGSIVAFVGFLATFLMRWLR